MKHKPSLVSIQCRALARYAVPCRNRTLHKSQMCRIHREEMAAQAARTMKRPKNWRIWLPASRQVLMDGLLMCGYAVPPYVIARWNQEQRADANKWAVKYYLRASDNLVHVPERPPCLDGYEERQTFGNRKKGTVL